MLIHLFHSQATYTSADWVVKRVAGGRKTADKKTYLQSLRMSYYQKGRQNDFRTQE